MTDKDFRKFVQNKPGYVVAFKFLSYDSLEDGGRKYDPLDEGLLDADNVSCIFRSIHTAVRLDSKTSYGIHHKRKVHQKRMLD